MIANWKPWKILLLGFVMTFTGMVIPFLMIFQVINSTIVLNFLSYTLSMFGTIIGFIGVAFMIRLRRE